MPTPAHNDYLKHQLLTKLHRLTATVAIKRTPSKRLKGKMTAPMYRELEHAIQLMAYSTRQKEDAIENILTAHEVLAKAIAENADNLTRGNTLLINLAKQLEQEGTPSPHNPFIFVPIIPTPPGSVHTLVAFSRTSRKSGRM